MRSSGWSHLKKRDDLCDFAKVFRVFFTQCNFRDQFRIIEVNSRLTDFELNRNKVVLRPIVNLTDLNMVEDRTARKQKSQA